MTSNSANPAWSVDDARAARQSAATKHGSVRKLIAPIASRLMPIYSKAFASIAGPGIYNRRMARVAAHMSRNRQAFDSYDPQAGDVVVSAYFKAGTNWIMHTCHQICHHGRAEFDHIQDVIPWPDAAEPRFWIHVNDPAARRTRSGMRVIKSHLPADAIPITPGAKFVAVTRDPADCAASAYHFFRGLVFGPSMPPPDVWLDFFASDQANFGRWDRFTASWYEKRDLPNVLFLTFEEVKQDNLGTIRRLADFMGVTLSEDDLECVADVTSFQAMKKINHKFYPAQQSAMADPTGDMIRSGKVGGAKTLFSSDALKHFEDKCIGGLAELGSDFPYQRLFGGGAAQ